MQLEIKAENAKLGRCEETSQKKRSRGAREVEEKPGESSSGSQVQTPGEPLDPSQYPLAIIKSQQAEKTTLKNTRKGNFKSYMR